ncbi:MAG: Arc family DNA-binding protein [Burkholderiaceae bacterium]|jgi:hypothetical protein|nr:Arc family DNA-binding protein [Burkholderiaceae bacterium]MDR3018652.1 Arc family DNA-binding protein [Delftia acidovorans]
MATNQSQIDWQKTALRLPRGLHQQVHATALAEGRSFNSQIVAMLREGVATREAKEAGHASRG